MNKTLGTGLAANPAGRNSVIPLTFLVSGDRAVLNHHHRQSKGTFMKDFIARHLLVTSALLLLVSLPAHAATYYVSPSGNDGNSTLPLDTSLASSLTNANAAAESLAGAVVFSFFIMLELVMLATIGLRL